MKQMDAGGGEGTKIQKMVSEKRDRRGGDGAEGHRKWR